METVEGQTFENTEVRVDGKLFRNCTFRNALLVYSGDTDFGLDGCELDQIRFGFEGTAARIIKWVRQMKAQGLDVVGD